MDEVTRLDKIQKSLFDDSVTNLSEKEIELLNRYKEIFVVWLHNPAWSDKEIVNYIRQSMNLSRTQAYDNVQKVKVILGNVRNASKEWQRYRVIEMCTEAYALAKKRGDIKAMVMAADKLGKYTMLDKDDIDIPNWEDYVPPQLEPTSDVSVLGVTRSEKFKKQVERMKKKYLNDDITVQDAELAED